MSTLQLAKVSAILLTVVLAGAPLSPALRAQDLEGLVEVNVPFAFESGSQHFAPGLYTISRNDQNVIAVRGESKSGFVLSWFDEDGKPSNTTKVVFRKYGDQFFLQEVWVSGDTSHTYFPPSKEERREMAANRTASTTMVVAALERPSKSIHRIASEAD
jgi:hypothetical protein